MKKMTFQRAKELNLVIETDSNFDINQEIFKYHQKLNNNEAIIQFIKNYLGDNEEVKYLLADNFENIPMQSLDKTFNVFTPELLIVFTNRRILCYKNIKNKAYYRNKNQIPGLERGFHLFNSCLIIKYDKIEHVYFERNTLKINLLGTNNNDKNDKIKNTLNIYDFCFDTITKIFGNYM